MTKNSKGSSNPPQSNTKLAIKGKEMKTSSSAKKKSNEIDEIFASKKRKIVANKNSDKPKVVKQPSIVPNKTVKKQKKKEDGDAEKGNRFSEQQVSGSKKKRKTGDGLVIYTEEELGIGKADAGGTKLCPFDCDCCF